MFETFKTDLIYFNTPTDFEMEFNLCGCCRMRTFNDKCSDKKSLLLSLSRAVSRSRIIIITAPLFTDNNVTSAIASAIGSKTQKIDNAKHNINSDVEIHIIKDSLPLVTPDGIFGGCLIQSGPQTLILLTDNKGVRKTIMQTLIHPYIKDLSVEELKKEPEETDENLDPDQIITEDEPETDDEPYEYAEDVDLVTEDDDNSDEDENDYYADEYKDLYIESTPTQTIDDDDDDYDDDYYTDTPTEKPSPFNIWFLIISLLLLVTVAVLCFCIFFVPTKAGIEPSVYLKEIFDTMFV